MHNALIIFIILLVLLLIISVFGGSIRYTSKPETFMDDLPEREPFFSGGAVPQARCDHAEECKREGFEGDEATTGTGGEEDRPPLTRAVSADAAADASPMQEGFANGLGSVEPFNGDEYAAF